MSKIKCIGEHRGVGLHDQQGPERLKLVKGEIDRVLDRLEDIGELYAWCRDAMHAPESRALAAAKIHASWSVLAATRGKRPANVTLEDVDAAVAGVNSHEWRDPQRYCSMLDADPAVPRERPLRSN